jgi:glycosyltransferase involved in cell wall biosynthesis
MQPSDATHLTLQILAWLLALAWLFKLLEAARGLPTVPNLTGPAYDRAPKPQPSLTVIVPARNEAAAIAACLESLLAQDYPNLRILAVNDRSTDSTGSVMEALARAHPDRLEALHIAELPPNWLGKTHAMAIAVRQAVTQHSPDYLFFTDADIHFHPEVLRRSLACAVSSDADHFVTLPTALARSTGEAMLLSFLQVMGLFAVRPWRVADPRALDAIGVGAFNLIRTRAYLQLGGFDAIPMAILEDLTLGRRVKLAGLRQRVAHAPGMVTLHWAAGVRGILHGMTKNLYALFHFRSDRLLAAAAVFSLFCLAPFIFLATPGMRVAETLTLASIAGLYALSSRTSRISPWNAALFPIAALLVVYSMLRSMIVTLIHGGVTWRGTFYPLAVLRKHPGPSRRLP